MLRQPFPQRQDLPDLTESQALTTLALLREMVANGLCDVYTANTGGPDRITGRSAGTFGSIPATSSLAGAGSS
jgi:nitrate reductase alpha subunit